MWSRTPMVKCRIPFVLIVSFAVTAGVATAASVMAHSVCRSGDAGGLSEKMSRGASLCNRDGACESEDRRVRASIDDLHFQEGHSMRFSMRLMRLALACVTAALGLPAVANRAAAQTVRVGIVNSSTDVPFFIADAKGYFREEGLSVE